MSAVEPPGDLGSALDDFEPDCGDWELVSFHDVLARITRPSDADDYLDPRSPFNRFARQSEDGDLALFAAALYMRTRRLAAQVSHPAVIEAGFALCLLLLMLAAKAAIPGIAAGTGDIVTASIPSEPAVLARALLTAAPPARVPCPAGTAG